MKTSLFAMLAFGSLSALANPCVMELQYQGTVLGQNVFSAPVCREAMRECKRTQMNYERNHMLEDLQCVRVDVISAPMPPQPLPPGNGGTTRPLPPPHTPAYTRLDAMRDLERMENDQRQASENFNLIMQSVDQGLVDLQTAVETFGQIMQAHGGANHTAQTQKIFSILMEEVAVNWVDVAQLAASFANMARAEGDSAQAEENLKLILDHANLNQAQALMAMEVFTQMLEASGARNTAKVREAFAKLISVKLVPLDVAARDYQQLRSLENEDADAMNNYLLVLEAVKIARAPYREAMETMAQLNQRYGANATATAQTKFKEIFRL